MRTIIEWRVTGQSAPDWPYEFIWSSLRNPHLGDPEAAARQFVTRQAMLDPWTDGPHLHRRTITIDDWVPA